MPSTVKTHLPICQSVLEARAIPTIVCHQRSVCAFLLGADPESDVMRYDCTAFALKSTYGAIRLSNLLHPLSFYQAYSFRWSYFAGASLVDNEIIKPLFWEGLRVLVYIRYTAMVSPRIRMLSIHTLIVSIQRYNYDGYGTTVDTFPLLVLLAQIDLTIHLIVLIRLLANARGWKRSRTRG